MKSTSNKRQTSTCRPTLVARSVAALFGATTLGFGVAQAADSIDPNDALPAISVTAQRRLESIQDVPITVQAITFDQMQQLGITTIDEAVKYLPNVTLGSNGPGQGSIFMRGLSSGVQGNQSSATIAPFPNVALYLDDQSMTFPARNLDVYFVDMERVEVLEGPQGTLFGGGAEAGVVRYVTNKPKLNKTTGSAEVGYGVTAGGDPNSSANAVLNVPIIPEKFAVRAALYNDHRGGYITNVASNFTRGNNDIGNSYLNITPTGGVCPNGLPTATGFCAPVGAPVGNNLALTGSASNPVDYQGGRISALYEINDNWDVLIQQSYQHMNAQGLPDQYPIGSDGQALGADQITMFSPSWDKDNFESTSWTVNGQIDDLKAIYTGSYQVRNIDQQTDYTNYSRTLYGVYYTCSGGSGAGLGGGNGKPVTCYSPVTSWRDIVKSTHQAHELRLTTPDTWRLRGIGGVYWEDFKIYDNMNFNYRTIPSCNSTNLAIALAGGPDCVSNVSTAPNSTANNPGMRGDNTAYGEDAQRGYTQTALFGSLDYDLIPKTLTFTAGTRYYRYNEYQVGSVYSTGTRCVDVLNGNCAAKPSRNMDAEGLRGSYHGFKSRFSLAWHIDPDMMVYGTYSQGFRPGAFNRYTANDAKNAAGVAQYLRPTSYSPDSLDNFEVGFKSNLLNHKLELNATAYHMVWNDVQFLFYDPGPFSNSSFATNGPTYTINGLELQAAGKLTHEWTLQGSLSLNDAKETTSPCLIDNNPADTGNVGKCITEVKGVPFANPYGLANSRPAFSPIAQFSLRARYDSSLGDYKTFVAFGANHTGSMSNQPASYPSGTGVTIPTTTLLRYDQPGYTLYDLSFGASRDNWRAQVNCSNLFNSNASTFTSSTQFIKQEVPVRPRVIGLTLGFSF